MFVTKLFCRGFTTSDRLPSAPPHTIFRAGRGNVTSRSSQMIARKGPSMHCFCPPRCAFLISFISEGAWAPPPISTECDGRWSRWQILFSPCPDVSRLVLYSNKVWQAVFSSGEASVGSRAPRRAPPDLPSDLGKIPFHTKTALECRVVKNDRSYHFPRYNITIEMG